MDYINKSHEQQINYLKNVINGGKNSERFRVIGLETSTGKTKNTCYTLAKESNRPTLLVVKFNEEQLRDMEEINRLAENENHALALTSYNFQKYKNLLQEYQILIISHKRYLMACQGYEVRMGENGYIPLWSLLTTYKNGYRENLIIDENVNWIESWSYSNSIRQKFAGKLIPEMEEHFQNFNKTYLTNIFQKYIEDFANLKETKKKDITHIKIYNFNKLIAQEPATKQLNQLIEEIKNNTSNDWRIEKKMTINNLYKTCPYETFLNKLKLLIQSDEVIMNMSGQNNTIPVATYGTYTYPKLLYNNILLDANAKTDECYKINPIFDVNKNSNIILYNRSKFIVTDKNCSGQTIKSDRFYMDTVVNKIKDDLQENDKILIITSNDTESTLKNKFISQQMNYKNENDIAELFDHNELKNEKKLITTNHFQNLIGKNIYREFNKAYSIASPKLPQENYILMYRYHSGNKLSNKYNYNLRKSKMNGNLYFYNGTIQRIADSSEAQEIMQSLKRIQRCKNPKGEYYLIHNNEKIIDIVTGYFKDINIISCNWFDEYKSKLVEQEELKNNTSQWAKLINWFETMEVGKEYKKGEIEKQLHISKLNRILKDKRVKEYIDNNNIKINNFTIIRH